MTLHIILFRSVSTMPFFKIMLLGVEILNLKFLGNVTQFSSVRLYISYEYVSISRYTCNPEFICKFCEFVLWIKSFPIDEGDKGERMFLQQLKDEKEMWTSGGTLWTEPNRSNKQSISTSHWITKPRWNKMICILLSR